MLRNTSVANCLSDQLNFCETGYVTLHTYLLHVDFNVFLQVVAIQVEHKVVDEVKAVTHNDEGQLVGQFRLLFETRLRIWCN